MFTTPSDKQLNMIVHLFETADSKTFRHIWNSIPKNNKKYPDVRADYKRVILSDVLFNKISKDTASYLIKAMTIKYDPHGVVNVLKKFKVII